MSRQLVLVTKRARLDLDEIATFIAHDNVDAAIGFIDAVEMTCQRLADAPDIGTKRSFAHASLADIRSLTVSGFANYLVFYRVLEGRVEVIRILHGARDVERVVAEE